MKTVFVVKVDLQNKIEQIFGVSEKKLIDFIVENGTVTSFKKDDVVIEAGTSIRFVPLILSGSLRIMLVNPAGAEYFLYHLYSGETCAVSLACCLSHSMSEVKAIAEEKTEILMISLEHIETLESFKQWKKFVAQNQTGRFSELLETIELIAFSKLDNQLWSYLLKRAQAQGTSSLSLTHQEIANEHHSPREVISRLLHQLQYQGKITLARNQVTINSQHFIV